MKRIVLILLFLIMGCASSATKLEKAQSHIDDSIRIYVAGTGDALARVPAEHRVTEITLAQELNSGAQSLAGLPPVNQRLDISKILAGNRTQLDTRVKEDSKAQVVREESQQYLIELGKIKEAENKKNLISRIWAWAVGSFGLVGAIAFIVFFPTIALPLLGQLLAWIVRMIPSLFGFLGVVGKAVFTNLVDGITSVRSTLKANPKKSYTGEEVQKMIDDALKQSTDNSTKQVIEAARPTSQI